jgi:hypothetical protein
MPALILAAYTSEADYLWNWRVPKYFDTTYLGHSLLCLAAFALPMWLVGNSPVDPATATPFDDRQIRVLRRAALTLSAMTLLGYAAWTVVAVARGLSLQDVSAIFSGTPSVVGQAKREFMAPVSGLTTMTQFGPAAVTCSMFASRQPSTPLRTMTALIVASAGFRAVVYAERLALLEVVIPLLVIYIWQRGLRRSPGRLLRAAPLWAPIVLLLLFGTFEYLRSWTGYYKENSQSVSYAGFVTGRLMGYYVTAANNSAVLLETAPVAVPYYTLKWLWDFPLLENILSYESITGESRQVGWRETLLAHANPEFNNEGALLIPSADLGIVGGVAFWLIVGSFVGATFSAFRNGHPKGLLLYPVLYIGLLELGRILYWTSGRAVPSVIAALIVAHIIAKKTNGARAYRASVIDPSRVLAAITDRENNPPSQAMAVHTCMRPVAATPPARRRPVA